MYDVPLYVYTFFLKELIMFLFNYVLYKMLSVHISQERYFPYRNS